MIVHFANIKHDMKLCIRGKDWRNIKLKNFECEPLSTLFHVLRMDMIILQQISCHSALCIDPYVPHVTNVIQLL